MILFNWDDKLKTDHVNIDNDHKKLVDLVNMLFDAMQDGKGKHVCDQVLNELITYTRTHFVMEEHLMATHNYAKIVEHKAEHAMLLKKVDEFKVEYEEGSSLTVPASLLYFLRDWLINHISKSDKALAQAIAVQ